jgi:hypothetical protein
MPRSPGPKFTTWKCRQRFAPRALADKVILDAAQNIHDNVDEVLQALAIAGELGEAPLLVRALVACGAIGAFDAEAAGSYFAEALGGSFQLARPSQTLADVVDEELSVDCGGGASRLG